MYIYHSKKLPAAAAIKDIANCLDDKVGGVSSFFCVDGTSVSSISLIKAMI